MKKPNLSFGLAFPVAAMQHPISLFSIVIPQRDTSAARNVCGMENFRF
jgi:hypothetical protein